MRAEFSVKRYLNIKLSVLFVYNDLIHQHPEMRITYRTVGYNTVKQLYAFLYRIFNILHFPNSVFDCFNTRFAGNKHSGINFGVFSVPYSFKQYLLLVVFPLRELILKRCYLLFGGRSVGKSFFQFSVNPFEVFVSHYFKFLKLFEYQNVKNFLADFMRRTVFLSVTVVAVANIFHSRRIITPISCFTTE